jgi:hypothetical protein
MDGADTGMGKVTPVMEQEVQDITPVLASLLSPTLAVPSAINSVPVLPPSLFSVNMLHHHYHCVNTTAYYSMITCMHAHHTCDNNSVPDHFLFLSSHPLPVSSRLKYSLSVILLPHSHPCSIRLFYSHLQITSITVPHDFTIK